MIVAFHLACRGGSHIWQPELKSFAKQLSTWLAQVEANLNGRSGCQTSLPPSKLGGVRVLGRYASGGQMLPPSAQGGWHAIGMAGEFANVRIKFLMIVAFHLACRGGSHIWQPALKSFANLLSTWLAQVEANLDGRSGFQTSPPPSKLGSVRVLGRYASGGQMLPPSAQGG